MEPPNRALRTEDLTPHDGPDPLLFPEVQVSRQFAFHVLQLPGEKEPTFHRYFHQAVAAAQYAGFDTLTVVVGETQYQLREISPE